MPETPSRRAQDALERRYAQCVRPDVLAGVAPAATPAAVLVAGPPGAGTAWVAARVCAQRAAAGDPAALVVPAALAAYVPASQGAEGEAPAAPAAPGQALQARWAARLVSDAIAQRASLVVDAGAEPPERIARTAARLRAAGYAVAAVAVAADRDASRLAMLVRFDLDRAAGLPARVVPAAEHEAAWAQLAAVVARLETGRAVDRLQVMASDARELYANRLAADGDWERPPAALAALAEARERPRAPPALAQAALCWTTLATRFAGNASVPRALAAQVLAWQREAVAAAEREPEARERLAWGRAAEAFQVLAPEAFVREFPDFAKAAARLAQAQAYAAQELADAHERARFVATARSRIAERIAEGQLRAPDREPPARGRAR